MRRVLSCRVGGSRPGSGRACSGSLSLLPSAQWRVAWRVGLRAVFVAGLASLAPLLPAGAQSVPAGLERRPDLPQAPVPASPGLVMPQITVDLPPGLRPAPGSENETVEVAAITVSGNHAISDAEISAITAPLIGKETTMAGLYGAAQAISRLYAERGWFLSFAYFPAQSVEDGRYRIQIVEGKIGQIRVEGLTGALGERVKERLAALAQSGVAELGRLERALLLLRDEGGVELSAALEPTADPTHSEVFDLVVEGKRKAIDALLSFDNRGSKYAGPGRGYAEAAYHGLFGLGETMRVHALGTTTLGEQRYGGLDLALPLGEDGWRLDVSGSYTRSHAGYDLKPNNLRSEVTAFDTSLTYPLIRSGAESLWLAGGFHLVNLYTTLAQAPLYTDRTRSVSLSASWEMSPIDSGRTRITLRGDKYLGLFAPSIQANTATSRHDSNNVALRGSLEIVHSQRLFEGGDLILQALGQESNRPLYSLDKLAPGGARFGRAYDAGEISGNKGAAFSAEFRLGIDDFLPEDLRGHLYGFYDGARVWDKRTDGKVTEAIYSGGGGLRLDWNNRVNGWVEYAEPVARPVSAEAPNKFGRVFFGVTLNY